VLTKCWGKESKQDSQFETAANSLMQNVKCCSRPGAPLLMSVGSRWKCVDMLSVEALWWREKGAFCLLIFGWMILVQVTFLGETDFGFQSKHIHIFILWNIVNMPMRWYRKFRNFGRCRKGKWLVVWHYTSFGCCRKINYHCFVMWNGCASIVT